MSPYFRAMFRTDTCCQDVTLHGMDMDTVNIIINYCYTGTSSKKYSFFTIKDLYRGTKLEPWSLHSCKSYIKCIFMKNLGKQQSWFGQSKGIYKVMNIVSDAVTFEQHQQWLFNWHCSTNQKHNTINSTLVLFIPLGQKTVHFLQLNIYLICFSEIKCHKIMAKYSSSI